jgi:hypothetical protein
MHQENSQCYKQEATHNGRPNDGQSKPSVEKKGFKRAEAAVYLGVAKITIDRLTKRGLLHPSRALRHPIYSRDDLDRFLRDTSGAIGGSG